MQIHIYTIEKKPEFETEIARYIKLARPFAKIEARHIYDPRLKGSRNPAALYTTLLERYTGKGFDVILTPDGVLMDTPTFVKKILEGRSRINFYIGGAYGFNREFKEKGFNLSLSPLTFSHKIAKLVLIEQIYRGLTIINNHPYDK
ncbi:MAG: 23S rRNA (pseudouridine(1915)-N(3))-methyltransferase RlmH [Campylobacterales bacterium]